MKPVNLFFLIYILFIFPSLYLFILLQAENLYHR